MLANLAADMRAALDAGDLDAARVASDAMARLLGGPVGQPGPAVDLGSVRDMRRGSGRH